MEKTISLPKNQAVALGTDFDAHAQARLFDFLATLQEAIAKDPQAETPADVSKKLLLAGERARAVIKHFDSGNSYAPMPGDRAHEPASARVDALCCIEYA